MTAIKVWAEKWADIILGLVGRTRTYKVPVVAAAIMAAVVLSPAPAEAAETTVQCDPATGAAAVLSFETGQSAGLWSLYPTDGGDVVTFGETDNVPVDKSGRWTQTAAVDPGREYVWYFQGADLGERLEFSWEWVNVQESSTTFTCTPEPDPVIVNPVIEPVFYDPTPSPYSYLEWIRDVYRRALRGCSTIGAYEYEFCPV